jgi:hypothetical protein
MNNDDLSVIKNFLLNQFKDNSEFENFIENNLISGNFCDLESDTIQKIITILHRKTTKRGYVLIFNITDNTLEYDNIYIDTTNENETTKIKEFGFGNEKNKEIIIKPKRVIYKFSPFSVLSDVLTSLKEKDTNFPNNANIKMFKSLVESLLKITDIIIPTNLKEMSISEKKDWFSSNHALFFLFENKYNNDLKSINNIPLSILTANDFEKYKKYAQDVWNILIEKLQEANIKIISINPGETVVEKAWLSKGWQVRNDENKTTIKPEEDFLVYDIIQHGIEIDGEAIRMPIVNAMAYKKQEGLF